MQGIESKRPRILAFDLIRGLFLVIISVNHLALSFGPSIFLIATGASALPASAAEGFFLISGIMVGYVYGPKILIKTKDVFKHLWKRAGLLWVLSVSFTIAFLIGATILDPEGVNFHTFYSEFGSSIFHNTFLLRFTFGWADFLSRYALFMVFAPVALWLIAKRFWWVVAGASLGVWLLFRTTHQLLPFSAWQIIFIAGIFAGYYWPALQLFFKALPSYSRSIVYYSVITASIVTFALSSIAYVIIPTVATVHPEILNSPLGEFLYPAAYAITELSNKTFLDPLRLIVGLMWFSALYLLVRPGEGYIDKKTRGVLSLLGRNSLFVYCIHAIILFFIGIYIPKPDSLGLTLLFGTILAILFIISIYLTTKYRHSLITMTTVSIRRILKL